MPGWDGTGQFQRVYNWEADKLAGINIIASRMDTDTDNITNNGFGNCLTRDGQGSATDDLPMNNYRHTGVGDASKADQYTPVGQLQSNVFLFAIAAGTSDAITAAYTPAIDTLTDGMQLCFRVLAANTTTTPTFKPDTATTHQIKKLGGQSLAVGDLVANMEALVRFDEAEGKWELLNPVTTTGQAQLPWAIAGGTADAITATYSPATPALSDGLLLSFRASAANTTTTPTFAPDGLTAHTITKFGGSTLVAGDIYANRAEYLVRYNLSQTRWELLNPSNPIVYPTVILSGSVATGGTTILAIDFSSFTGYKRFEISIDQLIGSSSAAGVFCQYSINGGSSFISTATYAWSSMDFNSLYTYSDDSAATAIVMGQSSRSAAKWNATINVTGINQATTALLSADLVYYNGTVPIRETSGGRNSTNSINALKIFLSSGTVTSGTYRVVGYP